MRTETLIDAISNIDSDLIEKYYSTEKALSIAGKPKEDIKKPKARIWSKLGVIAACLCLVLIVGAGIPIIGNFISPSSMFSPPVYDEAYFEAKELGEIFNFFGFSYGVECYEEVFENSLTPESIGTVPTDEYVDIYKLNKKTKSLSKRELNSFESDIMSKFSSVFDVNVKKYEREEKDRSDTGSLSVTYEGGSPSFHFLQRSDNRFDQQPCHQLSITGAIYLDGAKLTIDPNQSEEEILTSFEPIKEHFFEIFGCSFEKATASKSYVPTIYEDGVYSVHITYEDKNMWSEGGFLKISAKINENSGNYDELVVNSITYNEPRVDLDSYYYVSAKCKRISFEEAEELLKKGYVFSGHSCPLCRESKNALSFEEYDFFGYEYRFDDYAEDQCAVPFYTFYKKLKTLDGTVRYAKASVCAVPVKGQDEYYQNMAQYHKEPDILSLFEKTVVRINVHFKTEGAEESELIGEITDPEKIIEIREFLNSIEFVGLLTNSNNAPKNYFSIRFLTSDDIGLGVQFGENKLIIRSTYPAYYMSDEDSAKLTELINEAVGK